MYHNKKHKKKASRFKGVYKCGRKWKAQIQIDGVQHYLGVFDSERVAATKYAEKAVHLGGPRSCLGGAPTTTASSTSSACSTASIGSTLKGAGCSKAEPAAMVGLGRTIRSLAELNSELSGALKRTVDPATCSPDEGALLCAHVTAQIQQQLSIQAMYIMHIAMETDK